MMKFELISEAASIKARPGSPVTGNIWLKFDDHHFPSYGWNDFVVVLMGWWANALIRLVRGHSRQEMVPFMDGPYTIEVTMDSSGKLKFRALQGESRNVEAAVGEESAAEFIAALSSQGQEVLKACRQHCLWSKDTEILESALEDLSKGSSLEKDYASPVAAKGVEQGSLSGGEEKKRT